MAVGLSKDLTDGLASIPFAIGVVVIMAGVLRSALAAEHRVSRMMIHLSSYVAVGLEFFLAAGLIRLSSVQTVRGFVIVAAIIALRRVITYGLRLAERSQAQA